MMQNNTPFDTLAQTLISALPTSVQAFENEIQQQFKAILSSAFEKMQLVSREEFDVQVNVLARTREKVDALQKQVDALLKNK